MKEYLEKLGEAELFKDPYLKVTLTRIINTVAAAAADETIKHAIDINARLAIRLIQAITDTRHRAIMSAIVVFGTRAKDVSRLTPSQIDIHKSGPLRMQVRVQAPSLGRLIFLVIT